MDIRNDLLEMLNEYTDGRITSVEPDDVLTSDLGLNSRGERISIGKQSEPAGYCRQAYFWHIYVKKQKRRCRFLGTA